MVPYTFSQSKGWGVSSFEGGLRSNRERSKWLAMIAKSGKGLFYVHKNWKCISSKGNDPCLRTSCVCPKNMRTIISRSQFFILQSKVVLLWFLCFVLVISLSSLVIQTPKTSVYIPCFTYFPKVYVRKWAHWREDQDKTKNDRKDVQCFQKVENACPVSRTT